MSTAAVSTSSLYQELQTYFQQRGSDLQQLGQALQSGNLADAQQEYSTIQTLAQDGPFANGDVFRQSQRQQDFAEIGQDLQSGDLTAAQQAFAQLQSAFQTQQNGGPGSTASQPIVINLGALSSQSSASSSSTNTQVANNTASSTSPTTPEIVLNLGDVSGGEQITLGLNNSSSGGEQLTISVATQQNQNPEQITLNLNQNANQEIILNLFNSAAGSATSSSGVSVTA